MKKKHLLLLTLIFTLLFSGCQSSKPQSNSVSEPSKTQAATAEVPSGTKSNVETQQTEKASDPVISARDDMFTFTDSAGREVTLPTEINKIAPSGPLAQIVLYTVCPDKLCGLASDFSEDAKQYIDEKYWGLPKFGQFYGKNANLNMEALAAEAPDVIIDIGEMKDGIAQDMDALQTQIGIPTIFVEATLPTMADAYQMLGAVTGETEQAEKLSAYCNNLMKETSEISASIPETEQKRIYFALGDAGLNTNARGSIHADVIEQIGAINVVDVDVASRSGGSEVSFEQLFLWQPDIIIADTQEVYDTIISDTAWQEVNAVKNGQVYKIPSAPYNFINNPPSVNRLIGIQWLGHLVYPDYYTGDLQNEIKEFEQLFYHLELSDEDIQTILKDALPSD